MDKLQDLSQSELQELLDNPERVDSMALESDEVISLFPPNSYKQNISSHYFPPTATNQKPPVKMDVSHVYLLH